MPLLTRLIPNYDDPTINTFERIPEQQLSSEGLHRARFAHDLTAVLIQLSYLINYSSEVFADLLTETDMLHSRVESATTRSNKVIVEIPQLIVMIAQARGQSEVPDAIMNVEFREQYPQSQLLSARAPALTQAVDAARMKRPPAFAGVNKLCHGVEFKRMHKVNGGYSNSNSSSISDYKCETRYSNPDFFFDQWMLVETARNLRLEQRRQKQRVSRTKHGDARGGKSWILSPTGIRSPKKPKSVNWRERFAYFTGGVLGSGKRGTTLHANTPVPANAVANASADHTTEEKDGVRCVSGGEDTSSRSRRQAPPPPPPPSSTPAGALTLQITERDDWRHSPTNTSSSGPIPRDHVGAVRPTFTAAELKGKRQPSSGKKKDVSTVSPADSVEVGVAKHRSSGKKKDVSTVSPAGSVEVDGAKHRSSGKKKDVAVVPPLGSVVVGAEKHRSSGKKKDVSTVPPADSVDVEKYRSSGMKQDVAVVPPSGSVVVSAEKHRSSGKKKEVLTVPPANSVEVSAVKHCSSGKKKDVLTVPPANSVEVSAVKHRSSGKKKDVSTVPPAGSVEASAEMHSSSSSNSNGTNAVGRSSMFAVSDGIAGSVKGVMKREKSTKIVVTQAMTTSTSTTDSGDGLDKYRKMLRLLPEGAVRHKMLGDGLCLASIDDFFGVGNTVQERVRSTRKAETVLATGPRGGGGGSAQAAGMSFLDGIRARPALKSAPISTANADSSTNSSISTQPSLLDQIRGGPALKKVDPSVAAAALGGAPRPNPQRRGAFRKYC